MFGAPAYYSTMHWESKHKQLKQWKEFCTNNKNHERDILHKAMKPQVHHLILYNIPDYVSVSINSYSYSLVFNFF